MCGIGHGECKSYLKSVKDAYYMRGLNGSSKLKITTTRMKNDMVDRCKQKEEQARQVDMFY